MDANTITAKLHFEADKELNKEIMDALEPFNKLRLAARVYDVKTAGLSANVTDAFQAISKAVFASLAAERRDQKVSDFIAKIGRIEDQIEELGHYRD